MTRKTQRTPHQDVAFYSAKVREYTDLRNEAIARLRRESKLSLRTIAILAGLGHSTVVGILEKEEREVK